MHKLETITEREVVEKNKIMVMLTVCVEKNAEIEVL